LAIVDDLGAILVIAVAYSEGLSSAWLALATAVVVLTILVRRVGIRPIPAYAVLGVVLWFALHHAGVHATVAGVIMGFIAPTVPLETRSALSSSQAVDLSDPDALSHHLAVARHSISVVERLLHALTPWTSLVIVPIFALANAGVRVDAGIVGDALTAPEVWGVIVGLVVGKPVGITVATMIAVRFGIATLPRNVGWAQVVSVAMVAGIGFTVSVFVADLAFDDAAVLDRAKLGILAASLVAGVVGLLAVRAVGRAAMADVDEDRTLEPPVPI
jgi:NhaA family Na+:H+ antiporter